MAATWYVSNEVSGPRPEAPAGYAVGVDTTAAGQGTDPQKPWLTADYIDAHVAAGDTVYINGAVHTVATALSISKGYSLYPSIPFGTTIRSVKTDLSQARVVNLNAVGGTINLGAFLVDIGLASATTGINHHTSNTATINLIGTKVISTAGLPVQGILDANTSAPAFYVQTETSGPFSTGGLCVTAMGATKRVIVYGHKGLVTGVTASNGGHIVMTATATGASARIENCDGLSVTSNSASSKCGVIHLLGVTGLFQNNRGMSVNEVLANTSSGLVLVDPVVGVQADYGRIFGNTGRNNTSGGYLRRVGTDSASAGDNLTNYWDTAFNDFTGNPNAVIMHGHMFGNCLGGTSFRDTARTVAIPFLTKLQTVGARFISPVAEMPVGSTSIFYSKGSVGAKCLGLEARLPRGYAGYVYQVSDDPTLSTHSTGAVCSDGNIWSDDPAGISLAVVVGVSNTATFENNNWDIVGVTGTPWVYQGVTYPTFAAWQAAKEPTARQVSTVSLNAAFHREAYKPFAAMRLDEAEPWLASAIGLR